MTSPFDSSASSSASPQRHAAFSLACVAALSLGCAGAELDQRDLGNTSTTLADDVGGSGAPRMPIVAADGAIASFIEGRWTGRAENPFSPPGGDGRRLPYAFPSGSTEIRLELSLVDPIFATGQIVFGSGSVPAPAKEVVYPPGFEPTPVTGLEMPLSPLEGFVYPMFEDIFLRSPADDVAAGELALSFEANGHYRDWCALQPSRPNGVGGFDCLSLNPEGSCSFVPENAPEERFDCALGELCQANNVCSCSEQGCEIARANSTLWLVRDGDDLLGNFADTLFDYGGPNRHMPVGTVRFERVNP